MGWPSQSTAAMNAYFGNPDANGDGAPDLEWQERALVRIVPPYALNYDGRQISKITVHRLCAESLTRVLRRIGERFDAAARARYGLDQFGGVFNFRRKRGGTSLSTHSWAVAIDLAVARNPFGAAYGSRPDMMPIEVVGYFEDEGWDWGGLWSNHDAMHFQAAKTGQARTTVPLGNGEYRWVQAQAVAPAPMPAEARPAAAPTEQEVRYVQTLLRALGYVEVGEIDGKFGSMTRGAILAFRADNGLPLEPVIDDALLAALPKAKPRQLAVERTEAKPKEVREQAPEAKANFFTWVLGMIGAATSLVVTFFGWLAENVGEVRRFGQPLLEIAGDVPWWGYVLVFGGVALWLFFNGRKGEAAAVAAFREGARR